MLQKAQGIRVRARFSAASGCSWTCGSGCLAVCANGTGRNGPVDSAGGWPRSRLGSGAAHRPAPWHAPGTAIPDGAPPCAVYGGSWPAPPADRALSECLLAVVGEQSGQRCQREMGVQLLAHQPLAAAPELLHDEHRFADLVQPLRKPTGSGGRKATASKAPTRDLPASIP